MMLTSALRTCLHFILLPAELAPVPFVGLVLVRVRVTSVPFKFLLLRLVHLHPYKAESILINPL
jgi:hypothetical protein